MANKTVIITGANSGLGLECARAIAKANEAWHIVIACRDTQKGAAAAAAIKAATAYNDISVLPLDLASLDSVRGFIPAFENADLPPLHGLICNAGIQVINGIEYTKDGFELMFGVNHLGHFLLTQLLLEKLVQPARILVVSSGTHDGAKMEGRFNKPLYLGGHQLAFPDGHKKMVGLQRYATSKLCNMMFVHELDRQLKATGKTGITVNGFDPGAIPGTNLIRSFKSPIVRKLWLYSSFISVFGIIYSTPERSGQALARLLLNPALENTSGKYYRIDNESAPSTELNDLEKAKELWETSLQLIERQLQQKDM